MVHTSAAAQERPQPLTGGRIPENDGPSYRLWQREGGQLPVLIAVPHSGRCYPAFLLGALRQPERASLRLEDRHVDALALPAAEATQTSLLLADAPRAMIDLNRSADDIDWGMVRGPKPRMTRHSLANRRSRNGLGLVPRRLPGMGEIWRRALDRSELDSWIAGIYHPYHAALSHELERLRDRWGTALLIDLHHAALAQSASARPAGRVRNRRSVRRVVRSGAGRSCDQVFGEQRAPGSAQPSLCGRICSRPLRTDGTRYSCDPDRGLSQYLSRCTTGPTQRAGRGDREAFVGPDTHARHRGGVDGQLRRRGASCGMTQKKTTPRKCAGWPRFREECTRVHYRTSDEGKRRPAQEKWVRAALVSRGGLP